MWGRARKEAERALAAARADCERLTIERDQSRQLAAQEARRADAALSDLEAARSEAAATRAEADDLQALVERLAGTPSETADRCWPLVLADITRRWAATVGVPPEARGIVDGPASEQISEVLAREVERMREEVGVDVSFKVTEAVEPSNPVVFLLTATDLLGAMASRCERVTVELDRRLVVTGEVWTDLGDELETSRARAVTAGALVDPIEVDDDQVVVALRP